ncbi:hypothetical protein BD289DRAFT_294786 [Coniella lustricola]|uniref:Uncharacterized protein n=1 Tax=Coniella lustricola TaxID=2025994 RepID=A0A2T3A505_9PEZI|nr:hypothetical protein BD289DRAFT_294786 [Coniella lustricola]
MREILSPQHIKTAITQHTKAGPSQRKRSQTNKHPKQGTTSIVVTRTRPGTSFAAPDAATTTERARQRTPRPLQAPLDKQQQQPVDPGTNPLPPEPSPHSAFGLSAAPLLSAGRGITYPCFTLAYPTIFASPTAWATLRSLERRATADRQGRSPSHSSTCTREPGH